MKKLKLKNVLIGMVVFTALAAVLQFSACKQRPDKKDKGTNLEKFAIRFSVEGDGGSLKAEVEGTEINSGAEVEKGKTVIFTAKADEKKGFRIKSWTGLKAYPENTGTAKLVVSANAEIKVYFLNIVPEGFVAVPVPKDFITGIDINYALPDMEEWWKGIFVKGRKVRLSPYAIAKNELTYKAWYKVIAWAKKNGYVFIKKGKEGSEGVDGDVPTDGKNYPVTNISWSDCIIWCNAYTAMENGNENECVYRKSKNDQTVLKNASNAEECGTVFADMNKKGFRLPTEAEWEFAARYQGDGSKEDHKINSENYGTEDEPLWLTKLNSASGAILPVPDEKTGKPFEKTYEDINSETSRVALFAYWWNGIEWVSQTPEVESVAEICSKNPNTLGLYDMSGNIFEWCFDRYDNDPQKSDSSYIKDGIVVDPLGDVTMETQNRVGRGGAYVSKAYHCTVGSRNTWNAGFSFSRTGFRLACSIR